MRKTMGLHNSQQNLAEKLLSAEEVKSFWKDFQAFAMQGNVIDLTVGVVIGTAFKQLTTSLVDDIIMPPIGLLLGNANFSDLYINLSRTTYATLNEAQAAGAPTINYGLFLSNVIDFLLVALSVYIVLRFVLGHQRKVVV